MLLFEDLILGFSIYGKTERLLCILGRCLQFDNREYEVCLLLKIYSIDYIAFSCLQTLSLVSSIMTVFVI